MEPSEFVVTMLVANLASIPMQDGGIPLYSGLVPILTVLGVELILTALSMRSIKLRQLLCGKPVILIENGKILQKNLRSTRVTLDELTELLRGKDVLSPETVQYAILETNGNLSVFPFPQERPASAKAAKITPSSQALPYTIIADGYVYWENLRLAGKNDQWLNKQLRKRETSVSATWLMTVDSAGKIFWQEKE
jgi:uncharacterized membrane protein YcaP (DUF421 family)